MTANVNVVLNRREDVLRVPNTALRFRPENAAPAERGSSGPQPGNRGGAGGPQGGQGGTQAELFARLVEALSLTEAQQTQAEEFGQELRRSLQSVGAQGGGREEFIQAVREGRQRFNEQLVAILTEEQRVLFAELSAQRRNARAQTVQDGRIWVLGEDGKPRAVDIRYGITNGSLTEIVDGEIAAGDRIIVGAIAAARSRGLTGARF